VPKLTTPQKEALAFYYRRTLPMEERIELLKYGPRLKEPDPRVILTLGQLDFITMGMTPALAPKGLPLGKELFDEMVKARRRT
jgi:hypothetical protein